MSYIIGRIGEAGNIINTSYSELAKLEVQYEGTDTWLDCSVAGNISNKSNTSFIIRVKDGKTITNMNNMFASCTSLTSLDLSSFNTSSVTNMRNMLNTCSALTSLDLSNFNTSKVTNMGGIFNNCPSLTSLDLSSFDTSNLNNMSSMFSSCSSLTSLDVSSFDTSKVNNMQYMFQGCISLTSLDLSSFDTSKVTDMRAMFNNCRSLTSLDLSSFDTSKVTDMRATFKNCTSLTSLDLSNWNVDLSVLTTYTDVLSVASALEVINLSYANQDTISVIYNSVPSQAITVKVTPENMAYATDTAPSNVTVIDATISTIRITTTKQQLLYNILYGIQNANIVPHDKEELILYGIMMNQDVDVRLDTIVQILYYTLLKKGV